MQTVRQRVFINGDSDGVGVVALQLLKHYGHHVSVVCSAPNVPKFTQLVDAGGGEVIDHTHEPDWAARLAGEGKEYDVLLDTVGTDEAEAQCVKLLKRGGKYLSLRPLVLDLIHEHGPFMVRHVCVCRCSCRAVRLTARYTTHTTHAHDTHDTHDTTYRVR